MEVEFRPSFFGEIRVIRGHDGDSNSPANHGYEYDRETCHKNQSWADAIRVEVAGCLLLGKRSNDGSKLLNRLLDLIWVTGL